MIIKHRGFEPVIDSTVFVAPTAVLVGNLDVGPKSRIMYGAQWEDRISRYKQSTEVRSKEFASHFDDVILDK